MATRDGKWRPDKPFSHTDGLKITMRRAANLTPKGVLEVPFRFQVPPMGEFRRPYRFNWATFDTVSGGQHARPMGAQLLELRIETMFLDRLAAEATSGVVVWDGRHNPQRMLEELRYIAGVDDERKGKAAAFRLTINQPVVWPEPVVNILATLTSVEPAQQPGGIATEYVSVTFLEYPDGAGGRQQRPVEKPSHRQPVSLGHDSLYELAKRHLHQASSWRDIAKANGIKGVSPGSEGELKAWCERHHKTSLVIPRVELRPRPITGQVVAGGVAAGGRG